MPSRPCMRHHRSLSVCLRVQSGPREYLTTLLARLLIGSTLFSAGPAPNLDILSAELSKISTNLDKSGQFTVHKFSIIRPRPDPLCWLKLEPQNPLNLFADRARRRAQCRESRMRRLLPLGVYNRGAARGEGPVSLAACPTPCRKPAPAIGATGSARCRLRSVPDGSTGRSGRSDRQAEPRESRRCSARSFAAAPCAGYRRE